MRIAIVYQHDLREPQAGGVLQYTRALVREAAARGSVEFAYWCREGRATDAGSEVPGVEFRRLCGPRPGRSPLPESARIIWHIARKRREIEAGADAILVHGGEWVLPWAGRQKRRAALVGVFHGRCANEAGYLRVGQRALFAATDPVAVRTLDRLILVSEESHEYFCRRFPRQRERFVYVPTFADDAMIPAASSQEARAALGLPACPVLSFVGRLHPPKRLAEMLEVVARARESLPDLLFCVAGEGPQRAEMEAGARALSLDARGVRFMGLLDRREVGLLLRASNASILLSDSEGTPLGVLESLAIGTPVVVSDIADHRRIVPDGAAGFVVKNGSVTEIASRVVQIVQADTRFRLSAKEAGRAYLASAVVPRVMAVVEQAIADKPHRG